MTLLIGMHAGSYSLLAADTMESVKVDGELRQLHSSAEKIVETGLGPVTGSGLVTLLERVKQRLRASKVEHTDTILDIIHHERQAALAQGECSLDDLQLTSWMLSYRTRVDGCVAVRVVAYLPSIDAEHFVGIEPGRSLAVFPSDVDAASLEQVSDNIQNGLRVSSGETAHEDLQHNIGLIRSALLEVAAASAQVSTSFDLAMTTAGGTVYADGPLEAAGEVTRVEFVDRQ